MTCDLIQNHGTVTVVRAHISPKKIRTPNNGDGSNGRKAVEQSAEGVGKAQCIMRRLLASIHSDSEPFLTECWEQCCPGARLPCRCVQVSHHLDAVNLQHGSTSSCSLAASLTLSESNTGFGCACLSLMSRTVHRILHIQPGHEPMLRRCNLKPWRTVKLGQGHRPRPIKAYTSHGLSTGPTSRGWYVRTHIRQSVALL